MPTPQIPHLTPRAIENAEWLPYRGAKDPVLHALMSISVEAFLRAKYDYGVVGSENVPAEGPVVIAYEHVRAKDPPAVAVGINDSKWLWNRRYVASMAKRPLWTDSHYSWYGIQLGEVIEQVDAFPVDRPEDLAKDGSQAVSTSGL